VLRETPTSNPIPKAEAEYGEMIFLHSGPTKIHRRAPPIRVAKGSAVWFNHALAPGGDSPIAYARLGSRTGSAGALPPLRFLFNIRSVGTNSIGFPSSPIGSRVTN